MVSFSRFLCILFLTCTIMVSCSIFQQGPVRPDGTREPSVWDVFLKETSEQYNESPWADFGIYGAGLATVLATLLGAKKARNVYVARKAKVNEVPKP